MTNKTKQNQFTYLSIQTITYSLVSLDSSYKQNFFLLRWMTFCVKIKCERIVKTKFNEKWYSNMVWHAKIAVFYLPAQKLSPHTGCFVKLLAVLYKF